MAEKKLSEIPETYEYLGCDPTICTEPSAPIEDESIGIQESLPVPTVPAIADANLAIENSDVYYEASLIREQNPRMKSYSPPALAFEEIYEACVQYAKKHSFYGVNFANRMKLKNIDNGVAYQYILENFGEKRETVTEYTPYKGRNTDNSQNRPPPNPWDVEVKHPIDFMEHSVKLEMPNGTCFQMCSKCQGSSKVTCEICLGSGKKRCWLCQGPDKHDSLSLCRLCGGSNEIKCSDCKGTSQVICKECRGIETIKKNSFLVVTWRNHPYEFISDIKSLPHERLRKSEGEIILSEKGQKLLPLPECPDETVNYASALLLRKGEIDYPNEKIIQQRHVLKAIPFTTVKYIWKEKEGIFYVYGKDRSVYFEDYPENLSCTCS